jgi:hypothetical protein
MANTTSTTTYVAAIDQARITPLITDPVGGSATYGTSIVVPGVTEITATPKVKTVEINGDNQNLATLTFTNNCDVKFDFAEFSFDLVPYIWGGAVSSTGNDPNGIRKWDWSFERGALFKLEGRAIGTLDPGSDFHLVLRRVNIITPPPITMKYQDNAPFSCAGIAYKSRATGIALSAIYNGTAVAVA